MATLLTSAAVKFKAGANVSTDITTAQYDLAMLQAEGRVCAETRFNWVDAYSTLNVDVKYLLEDVTSNIAAIYVINNDMSGFTSLGEAQTMCDILDDNAKAIIKKINDQDTRRYITGA